MTGDIEVCESGAKGVCVYGGVRRGDARRRGEDGPESEEEEEQGVSGEEGAAYGETAGGGESGDEGGVASCVSGWGCEDAQWWGWGCEWGANFERTACEGWDEGGVSGV